MPTLLIHAPDGDHRLNVPLGQSVRDALDSTELRVRAACGGTGSCGACLIRLIGGKVTPPTVADYMKLTADERASGQRLACQMRIQGDAEVRLEDPAPPSAWRSIPPEDLLSQNGECPELQDDIYGVAVDLGTTHIRVALWDRKHGRRIATRLGPNPQGVFGADVLNRMDAAQRNPERATELARLARNAIVHAVRDILARDVGEVSPMLAQIGQVVIAGNTAMLALLSGHGSEALLDPEHWQRAVDCQPRNPADWPAEWFMPHAEIRLLDPVAGFIGSDLIADLLATDITSGAPGSLLMDVGTNTEIALWDGATLHLTSVPGGPAFEGVGIRHGMAAEPGAICRVQAAAASEEGFTLDVIGGGLARGLCGSGLADAVAVLLARGVVRPSGRFDPQHVGPLSNEGYLLDPDNPRSAIAGGDIDAFQRAKASVAAGLEALLRIAGMNWPDIRRLCVCGAFGRQLDIANAMQVGLLPPIAPSRIELFADATLAGCERVLLEPAATVRFADLTAKAKTINLSQVTSYEESYINHLRLRPMPDVVVDSRIRS